MIHVDAMLDSLSRSMSRSGFKMSPFNGSKTSTSTLVAAPASATGLATPNTPQQASAPPSMESRATPEQPQSISNVVHSSTGSSLSRSSLGSHGKTFATQVTFLDDTSHVFDIDKKAKGAALIELVFNHLEVGEREYFGLMFNDTGGPMPVGHAPDVMRWLDPQKLVRKQVRSASRGGNALLKTEKSQQQHHNIVTLYFRVKFYVTDPSRLHEEYTRYLMYLQVKRDLCEGRLSAPVSTISLLTSYAVQSTLGDYDPDTCNKNYLLPFRDLRRQSMAAAGAAGNASNLSPEEMDRRIAELHKLHKHQSPAEAEFNFLEHAKRLEMYGISLHPGKDSNGRDIQLGVTCIGLVVFQNQVKINTFSWSKIVKISFKRKQFFIQLRKELTESYDTLLGFNLASYRSCKNLWKSAVEHHSFFRLHSPKVAPRRFLLNLGSKFRYSGRTEFQTSTSGQPMSAQAAEKSRFSRSPVRKTLPLNLSSSSTAVAAAAAAASGTAPRLASPETSSIGSSVHSNGGLKPVPLKPSAPPLIPTRGQDSTSRNSQESTTPTSLAHRAMESFSNKVQSLSTKLPKKAWQEDMVSDDEGGFLETNRRISSLGRLSKDSSTQLTPTSAASASVQKAAFTPATIPSVRLPFADESSLSDRGSSTDGGSSSGTVRSSSSVIGVSPLTVGTQPPAPPPPPPVLLSLNGAKKSSQQTIFLKPATPPKLQLTPLKNTLNGSPLARRCKHDDMDGGVASLNDATNGDIVLINITPDEQGRFGFNVKGGIDQKLPIIVSRVGANTPADRCYPKLNEGDQVVMINGRDVSQHTHDQVVNFIRACSEPHSGQLVLAVRQNVYLGEEVEEPEFQYVPETPHISPLVPGTQALAQSMLLLEESLESGAVLGQFEQLYRRNTNLMMSICHLPENIAKNRYRDISPYDSTRVVLTECQSGDYINANHVVMTIPGSGIINRYIATQGPLAGTSIDFWYMIWECQSSLIIMLTTIVERGRIKCHNYWPEVGETVEYGRLAVTCTREDSRENFVFRDFSIRHLDKKKARKEKSSTDDVTSCDEEVEECDDDDEVRHVTQMAYLSWPDHGVPENPGEFIQFVETVRLHRQGSIYPTIVHCSAGIGRTGVLILMETALFLVEANQPVYPLDLTRIMRDQRASMIQTPSQYKFVCQAILKVFKEGQVKPLPEFCHST